MRGSVTAELAVVLPAVTALLAILLLGVSAGVLQLRLEEGARAGARALARGDSSAQVVAIVSRVAGEKSSVSLGYSDGYATVSVSGHAGGVLSDLVPWTQTAQASSRTETRAAGPLVGSAPPPHFPGSNLTPARAALWRWVRTPECPLRTGICVKSALHRGEAIHG
ncbi:TadE family type IV pilus minor pilin [Arthrobacter alpinus]|uniref:TadE family type IV pilus minor pilin n=1 Tax=Arthrobacter alpinus TaxID=656366 RepID=UPI0023B8773C|nr:TadE family type IV pilus minor pilin [Arthrobacter alpinus]